MRRRLRSNDILLLVALVVAAAVLVPRLLGARRAPVDEVKQKLAAGAVVVDVRTAEEFSGGAYPGARNIPMHEIAQRVGELPKDRPLVLYCGSGVRSGKVAQFLRQAGFTDVTNAGGLGDMPK